MSGYGFHYGPCSPGAVAVSAAPVVAVGLLVASYFAGDDPKPAAAKKAGRVLRHPVETVPATPPPVEPSAFAAVVPWLLAGLAVVIVGALAWQVSKSRTRTYRIGAYRSAAELHATDARPVGSSAGELSDSQRRELVAQLVAPVEMPEKVP